jgi:hypothetical protein
MLLLNARFGLLGALLAVSPLSASAQTVAPPTPVHPAGQTVLVAGGAASQIQPAIGGTLVTYTLSNGGSDVKVHVHDLASGADVTIPNPGSRIDQLSDVSGTLVVFVGTDLPSSTNAIMAYDTNTPALAPLALDPQPNVIRTSPAIGGRTVAWQELVGSSLQTDIVAFNLDTHQVTRLTTDGASVINRDPAVSSDGSVISWDKCPPDGLSCQVFAATRRPDGTWGGGVQLTSGPEPSIQPATNGQIVVYVGQRAGEWDLLWQPVGGGAEQRLSLPGVQSIPHISGSVVSFESMAPGASTVDVFVYDTNRGSLYQITNPADANAGNGNGVSLGPDGDVRVVWQSAQDVYAFSFRLKVSFGDLCTQTRQFVQSSARYQALSAGDKTRLDATTTSLCQELASAETALTPTQKAQLVSLYQAGVNALAQQGWLTAAQAATLITLSKSL